MQIEVLKNRTYQPITVTVPSMPGSLDLKYQRLEDGSWLRLDQGVAITGPEVALLKELMRLQDEIDNHEGAVRG